MSPLVVSLVFAAALLLSTGLKLWLLGRQLRHVARHRHAVPEPFASTVTPQAHRKAADYTLAKGRLGMASLLINAALLLGWTLLGGLEWLQQGVNAATPPGPARRRASRG